MLAPVPSSSRTWRCVSPFASFHAKYKPTDRSTGSRTTSGFVGAVRSGGATGPTGVAGRAGPELAGPDELDEFGDLGDVPQVGGEQFEGPGLRSTFLVQDAE